MTKSLWIFQFLTLFLLLLVPSFEPAPPQPSVRIVKSPLRHSEVHNAEVQLSVLVNQGYEIAGFVGSQDNDTYDYVWTLYNFITDKGETEAIVYGLITFKGVENRIWNLLAFVCWVFLVYVSMFGYVSQFIFRYIVLVRDINVSTFKYFLLLCLMLLFPFAYCVNLFICYYPPAEHAIMDDSSVAQMLGIDLSEQIVLAGYSFNDPRQTFGLYYVITVCTLAYFIMFTLAFLIQKLLENRTKMGASSETAKKMNEMNKQISRNLIVQASMPLIIYLSVLFLVALLLFKIDTNGWNWLQYYNLFSTIPMYLPSALNPIISICIIHYYRHAIISDTKAFGKKIKHFFGLTVCQQHEQPQQQQQPEKWAISVGKNVQTKNVS